METTMPAPRLDDTTTMDKPAAPKRRKGKGQSQAAPRAKKGTASKASTPFIAYAMFGVAAGLVVLSLAHLTEGIASLTGAKGFMGWSLCFLLAVGIDAGMGAAEALSLSAPENSSAARWASLYVVATLVLSAGLNAYVFALHAPSTGAAWAAGGLGVFIPAAVFALLRAGGGALLRR